MERINVPPGLKQNPIHPKNPFHPSSDIHGNHAYCYVTVILKLKGIMTIQRELGICFLFYNQEVLCKCLKKLLFFF